jgi:hypothetical protein
MPRGKSNKPVHWERMTMAMINGGVLSKEDILKKADYQYAYRISTLMYILKINGGIVKSHKQGRKVTGYELINPEEMKKYFTRRGFKPETYMNVTSKTDEIQIVEETKQEELETA